MKKHLFIMIFSLLATGLYSHESFAVRSLEFNIHQQYVSTRALGMGNAFTAIADDHSAILYNPAALALRKKGNVRFFLGAGLSDDVLDFQDDLDKISDTNDVSQINTFLQSKYGENLHIRGPRLGAFWTRPNWAVAFIPADLSLDMSINRVTGPSINVNAYFDSTLAYAYARNFDWLGKEHPLSIGLTAKAIHRAQANEAISALDLIADSDLFQKENAKEGLIVDLDFGSLWSPKVNRDTWYKKAIPDTLAFTVRNLLELEAVAQFELIAENTDKPDKIQRVFDLGTKYKLPGFWKFHSNKLAIDIRDVLHDNWSITKGLHIGAEFEWEMYSWWKGFWSIGLNQTFLSAGFGGQLGWFRLELTTWGEEVGTADSSKENRRYLAEISLDF